MFHNVILTAITLISNVTFAEPPSGISPKCDRILTHSGNIQIWRDWNTETRKCELTIHPMNTLNLIYRDYYFSNDGEFMVFNSYGDGPDSTSTGAREYYFFPRSQEYIDAKILENGDVQITHSNGKNFVFDQKTAQVKSIEGAQVKVATSINSKNKGGVEIIAREYIHLDYGFTLGKSPSSVKSGYARFYGPAQKMCEVTNKEITEYYGEGEADFKFSDDELPLFYKKRCPQLLK